MTDFIRFRLRIPTDIVDRLIGHGFAELPNECCGLLAGRFREDGGIAEVLGIYPLENELRSPTEFVSEPRGHLAAERDIRRRGWDVLAVYHSHPSSEPVPSKRDLERNYSDRVMNLILGMNGPQPELRGWWLTSTAFETAEWEKTPVGVEPT